MYIGDHGTLGTVPPPPLYHAHHPGYTTVPSGPSSLSGATRRQSTSGEEAVGLSRGRLLMASEEYSSREEYSVARIDDPSSDPG